MQTDVRTPLEIFSMPQHLTVPVFQRRYVWTAEKQWEPLWRDVSRVAERRLEGVPAQHFLGAVVTQGTGAGMGSLANHALIDGQQRLTTLQLLIDAAAAALDTARQFKNAERLGMLTHNPSAYSPDNALVLKLQHENDDRDAFVRVMTANVPVDYSALPDTLITQAHRYFSDSVREWLDDPVEPQRAAALEETLSQGLQIVVISLAVNEPSQEIFETLNARGTPLTAADLVKNFVFQEIAKGGGSADKAFHEHWRDLERPFWTKKIRIGRYSLERLSLFLNHWLVAQTGEEVSTRSTFTRFKSWYEQCNRPMHDVLNSLSQQARDYEAWLQEASKVDGDLSPIALFVYRTQAAELEAVKPLLLRLFDADRGIPPDVASRALVDIESWLMRRSLLRRPASEYSRVVAGLVDDLRGVGPTDVATTIRNSLTQLNRPGTYWPGDEELERELIIASIYSQPKARVRAYLEAIEDYKRGYTKPTPASASRVRRDRMTIEHLLPQRWRDHWPVNDLALQIERDNHVHRLGNLTLLTQTLNSSVTNGPWSGPNGKREALESSDTLLMTRDPRKATAWGEKQIDDRSQNMVEALKNTWPAPEGHNPDPVQRSEDVESSDVQLRDLVASGHLAPGTVLTGRDNGSDKATVTADGTLVVNGKEFTTPSGAGREVMNRTVNGWTFWRLPGGGRLAQVRRIYLGTDVNRKELYAAFWRDILERLRQDAPGWTQASSPGGDSWMTLPFGAGAARYTLSFTRKGPTVDLEFTSPIAEVNLATFEKYFECRADLEKEFGEPLTWEPLDGLKSSRIRRARPEGGEIVDQDFREALISWFTSTAIRLRAATQEIRGRIESSD